MLKMLHIHEQVHNYHPGYLQVHLNTLKTLYPVLLYTIPQKLLLGTYPSVPMPENSINISIQAYFDIFADKFKPCPNETHWVYI